MMLAGAATAALAIPAAIGFIAAAIFSPWVTTKARGSGLISIAASGVFREVAA